MRRVGRALRGGLALGGLGLLALYGLTGGTCGPLLLGGILLLSPQTVTRSGAKAQGLQV